MTSSFTMLKTLLFVMFVLLFLAGYSQNFTFDPGDEYNATLPMESFTDHFVYIAHDSPDSALISWRVVGNTCPEEWHISLCDWADCYSYLPNTGDMLPVAPGGSGFIKLTMNPYMIPGTGTIHFWIYPTGYQEEHIDLFYHFDTELVSVSEIQSAPPVFPNPFVSQLTIQSTTAQWTRITDMAGRVVFEQLFPIRSRLVLDTSSWPAGAYLLRQEERAVLICKP